MTHKHDFTIEQIKITPMNIESEDVKDIEQTISKLARGPKKGETEIEVFKIFASALERAFRAEISTFNYPSEYFKHWRITLPKDSNFDATPSRISVSFYIKRVENRYSYDQETMMYSGLSGIELPGYKDFLWRYMSFEKFVSLLDTESLFFTRADKFDDPFEGFTPPPLKFFGQDIIDYSILKKFQAIWRKYVMCSCWHLAKKESMAMWEKYHMHNSGIVIKTTVNKFNGSLSEDFDVYIGKTRYVDHYEYDVPQTLSQINRIFTWYFHKREPFEHEQEFRAIIAQYPLSLKGCDYISNCGNLASLETLLNSEFPNICSIGMRFNIDVNKLIDEVITSPYADDWFTDTVRSVARKYGFVFEVNSSTILDKPAE